MNDLYTRVLARLDDMDRDYHTEEIDLAFAVLRALLVERQAKEDYRGFESTDKIAEAISATNIAMQEFAGE